jgi:hypothetical protein
MPEPDAQGVTVLHQRAGQSADLPPALAHFHDLGLLGDDVLAELLTLEADFGPEVLFRYPNLDVLTTPIATEDAWEILNVMRPLDHPTLWPIPLEPGTEKGEAVAGALRRFVADVSDRRGVIPQWHIPALWWASQLVLLGRGNDLEVVRNHLAAWRESFRTALVWQIEGGFAPSVEDPEGKELKEMGWGYRSDLRHAGALAVAEAVRAGYRGFPGIKASYYAGVDAMIDTGDYPMPSGMQGRLDRLLASAESDDEDDDPFDNDQD